MATAHALQHLAGDVRIEERLSERDRGDRIDDGLTARLFQEVPGRARDDRGEERLVVRVGGEHDDLGLRPRLADGPAGLDAAAVR